MGETLAQNNEHYFLKVEISAHLLSRAVIAGRLIA